jgi:hypothetical protein
MNFKERNIGLKTTFRGKVEGKDELHQGFFEWLEWQFKFDMFKL